MSVQSVLPVGATLGEGPAWFANRLWFVDIKRHQVHRFDPAQGSHDSWTVPDQVGWVLPAKDSGIVAGLRDGLYRFDPETGDTALLHRPEPDRPWNRLNDATTDCHGRLWFGTMDDNEERLSGHLFRVADGQCLDSGLAPVAITNGPALNAEGTLLYHTDTLGKVIHRVRVNDDGSLGEADPFVEIEDGAGYPDGPVVDAEGCVWTGLFQGWGVRRYDPQGRCMQTVRFPVANITKISFGSADLRTAYATTARKGLSDEELALQPDAGNLFAFDPGVVGLPVTPARITGLKSMTG